MEIINGEGQILGRLASEVAKRLLKEEGKRIAIVNAEQVVVSGSKVSVFKEYKQRKDRGSREQGPYFPKMPDRIVKRTIRGMLPYKRARGRDAFSRLRVYLGVPEECEKMRQEKMKQFKNASSERLSVAKFVTLEEVSKKLGWSPKQQQK
ncbi:50S ribosomal protein L13 [ANME-1 cluster archaeon ex4572_4]|nr:50S ribosomal protein L13 [Methanophagales archaeon]OYT67396.1 MAG: 50S ribosomal protein L13 [ANME-1 cluster archaeon ex4572_4]PXF51527.1 MAG: 50S ribosomal protein L13 [Methanophagales archaeon]HDN68763.1 50S ribosomal protein L13 [Methanomicrobia archaeon]